MKLFDVLKAKPPAVPVTEWIDHEVVKTLQDEAQIALSINEPLQRLVACKIMSTKMDASLGGQGYFNIQIPLTAEGQKQLQRQEQGRHRTEKWGEILTVGGILAGIPSVCLVAVLLGAPLFGFLALPLIAVIMNGGAIATITRETSYEAPLQDLRDAASSLQSLNAKLKEAAADIETTLSLDEARTSEYLDAALDASPALEARFNREAARAAIRGPANPPQESRIIPKPIRRDIAV